MKTLKIILAILIFIAILDLPYGYYQFLRVIVSIGMAYFIYVENSQNRKWRFAIYVMIGVIFNPIMPIFLTREIWFYIDVVTGVTILIISLSDYLNDYDRKSKEAF